MERCSKRVNLGRATLCTITLAASTPDPEEPVARVRRSRRTVRSSRMRGKARGLSGASALDPVAIPPDVRVRLILNQVSKTRETRRASRGPDLHR